MGSISEIKEEAKQTTPNTTTTIGKEAEKKPVQTASNTSKEAQENSKQHSADVTKEIVCAIIGNSRDKMYITPSEACTISKIYEIIYGTVEALKKENFTYKKKTPTNWV